MRPVVGFAQIGDMQLDVVPENVQRFVTEQAADVAEIGIAADQFTGAAAAEDMRRDFGFKPGFTNREDEFCTRMGERVRVRVNGKRAGSMSNSEMKHIATDSYGHGWNSSTFQIRPSISIT